MRSKLTDVFWRPKVSGSPHALIMGMSGQGKSVAMSSIQSSMSKQVKTLVLDFHGDLSEQMMTRAKVVDVGSHGLTFDPFEPKASDTNSIKQHCLDLSDIFSTVCNLGPMQKVLVYKALFASYDSAAAGTPGVFPTIANFASQLAILESQSRTVNASARLLNITEFDLFSGPNSKPISFRDESTVINLSTLGSEELKRVAASLVLRKIYSEMHAWGLASKLELAIFLDEAHLLAKDQTLGKLFKEARKYGIGLILASQSIGDFSAEVIENSGLKMVFRLNASGAALAAKYIGGGAVQQNSKIIQELPVGTSLVSIQGDRQSRLVRVPISK